MVAEHCLATAHSPEIVKLYDSSIPSAVKDAMSKRCSAGRLSEADLMLVLRAAKLPQAHAPRPRSPRGPARCGGSRERAGEPHRGSSQSRFVGRRLSDGGGSRRGDESDFPVSSHMVPFVCPGRASYCCASVSVVAARSTSACEQISSFYVAQQSLGSDV